MQTMVTDFNDESLDFEAILAQEGIVRTKFLSKEGKEELAVKGIPFCIARVERVDSEYDPEHGQFVYGIYVPDLETGRLIPTLFSLGWNESREQEVIAMQKYLSTGRIIHSCKLTKLGKAKKGRQPFYQIVNAKDENGHAYCDGKSLEHCPFPHFNSSDVVDSDSSTERPSLNESLEL